MTCSHLLIGTIRVGFLKLGEGSQGRLIGVRTAKFNLGDLGKDKLKGQGRMCDRRGLRWSEPT